MTRLIWKEIRECWYLYLIWVFIIIVSTLVSYKQLFPDITSDKGLLFLSFEDSSFIFGAIFGLFVGGSAYSSELSRNRALFACSRPIAWWKLLIAKIIPGGIVLVITPLILFLLYYHFGFSYYFQYISWHIMLLNLGQLLLFYFFSYLIGIFSAPVLQGITGGFFSVTGIFIFFMMFVEVVKRFFPENTNLSDVFSIAFIIVNIGIIACGIFLAKNIARFNIGERISISLLTTGTFTIVGFVIGFIFFYTYGNTIPKTLNSPKSTKSQDYLMISSSIVSPDAKYSIVTYEDNVTQLIDLNSGEKLKFPNDASLINHLKDCRWLNDDLILIRDRSGRKIDELSLLYVYKLKDEKIYPIPTDLYIKSASLDSKYILGNFLINRKIYNSSLTRKNFYSRSIYTFPEIRKITTLKIRKDSKEPVWIDNNIVVYIDENGKQQFLQVKKIKQQGAK